MSTPARLLLETLEDRTVLTPVASITGLPAAGTLQPLLGETATFTFDFTNTGTTTGFGPYTELFVDATGDNGPGTTNTGMDGFGVPTVVIAGQTLNPIAIITVSGPTYINPLLTSGGLPVVQNVPNYNSATTGYNDGDLIYIYGNPFGSFTPTQTTTATITLPTSSFADLNQPLEISFRTGFRDDSPALDGPPIIGTTINTDVTPQLWRLNKEYVGPESETATGPNYVRRYRLVADVADGQTVSNLQILDDLASSMQLVGRNTDNSANGLNNIAAFVNGVDVTNVLTNLVTTGNASLGAGGIPTAPDGTVGYNFGTLTGTAGAEDAVLEFNFFVPRDTSAGAAVVDQGVDSTNGTNTVSGTLDWDPADPLDSNQFALPPAPSGSVLSHTLEQHSVAVQKSMTVIDPATGNPPANGVPRPGNSLIRVQIEFQVSDYFAVQNMILNDTISDGLRLFTGTRGAVNAGVPTLSVNNAYIINGGGAGVGTRVPLATGAFGGGNIDYTRRYSLQSTLPTGTESDPSSFPGTGPTDPAFTVTAPGTIDGSTLLQFDVSEELIRRLGADAGRLVGGEIDNDGTGPENDARPTSGGDNLGAATGTIVYYLEMVEDFSDSFPSVDRSVDQGDSLNNSVDDTQTGGRDGVVADQIAAADINSTTDTDAGTPGIQAPVIGTSTDNSGASVSIPYGVNSKEISHINGQPVPAQNFSSPPFSVQAGDRITYRLTYTLPITSFEALTLSDFPPLPVMPVGASSQYDFQSFTPNFAAYTVAIDTSDTFFTTTGALSPVAIQAATTAPLAGVAYNPAGVGSFTGFAGLIDGQAIAVGQRILVKNQANAAQNGIYILGAGGVLTRDTSFDTALEVQNSRLYRIVAGTVNGGRDFLPTNRQFVNFNQAGANGSIIFESFITTDPLTNQVRFNFGNFQDDLLRRSTTISLLLTLPVGNDPFATDLFLTNQLRVNEASTGSSTSTTEDLQRFELVRPQVTINKGVVGANSTGFTLGGIQFNNPTLAAGFTGGPVDTGGEATAIGSRDIGLADNVDAGDRVRFGIVVQNTGKGDAFDVRIRDVIPIQYNRATFNPVTDLRLFRGSDGTTPLVAGTDYTVISYTPATGELIIELTDNYSSGNFGGATEDNRLGGLSRGERTDQALGDVPITNGSNTVLVLYDVTIQNTATPNQTITNTAFVTQYATNDGGPDLTDPTVVPGATEPSDDADVIIKLPITAKVLTSTEVGAPGNNNTGGAGAHATIGEIVTYTVTITVPEGSTPGAVLIDDLDNGLAYVDITSVVVSAGIGSSATLTPAGLTATQVVGPIGGQAGRRVTFNLGDLTNTNTVNSTPETIAITYRVVVLNTNGASGSADNQAGQTRNNRADFNWTNNTGNGDRVRAGQTSTNLGGVTGTATPVRIVEPVLTNFKDVRNVTQGEAFGAVGANQSTRGDLNDIIEYRITINNPALNVAQDNTTRANDVTLSDPLPTTSFLNVFTINGVSQTGAGQVFRNGTAVTLTTADFQTTGGILSFNSANNYDIEPGVTITVTFGATGFLGTTASVVDNIADVRWSSLDDQRTPTGANPSANNAAGVERTGANGEGGGLNNYADNDNAVIEAPPVVRKTIVATSEPNTVTTGTNVAVGEIVRYRVAVSLPEGTARNFQIADVIPAGMAFLNDGTARYAFVSTGGNSIASATVGSVPLLTAVGIDGNQSSIGGIASSLITGTFADANVSTDANGAGTGEAVGPYAEGARVFFRFGTLNNTDNDSDVEYVVVEFNALVLNVNSAVNPFGNQSGVTLTNQAAVLADTDNNGLAGYIDIVNDVNGDGVGAGEATIVATDTNNDATGAAALANGQAVTIVEPVLAINKQVVSTTGSVVTYRVTVINTGNAPAFNTTIADLLPVADLDLVSVTGLTPGGTGATAGTDDHDLAAGNRVRFLDVTINAGGSVSFEYVANVLTTPTGATAITNTASTVYTSLPGALGTGGTWSSGPAGTSSVVPGSAGSATGERTGQGGPGADGTVLNNYSTSDTQRLGSLGDRVYFDADADGVQDAGEAGIVGVTVTVRWAGSNGTFGDGDDSVITTTTGANGIWTVTGLPLGAGELYQVSVPTVVGGMGLTDVRDNGGAANTNPDSLGTGVSAITLTGADAGTTNNRIQDFGYRGTASIGDRLFVDANNNGVQDAVGLEPGLPGVTVSLEWAGLDGDFATAADNLTFTTVTSNPGGTAGNYLFQFLPSGNYRVSAPTTGGTGGVPANMTMTDALNNGGAASTDPTGTGAGFVQLGGGSTEAALATGEARTNVDFGYLGNASLGDYVWYDVNGDGIQDANEPPIPGATVAAVWFGADGAFGGGDDVTFTTTTDANGFYTFNGIPANALIGGTPNYRVTVTPPAAFPTLTDSINDGALNATNPVDIQVSPVNGVLNDRVDVDFGFRGTASLGNLVFRDQNGNGRQDGGDAGIDGVSVDLFFDRNNDGDFLDAGENVALAATTTTGGGLYAFNNLAAGNYRVQFGNSDGVTTFTRTTADVTHSGTTDAQDSDANVTNGFTGTYTLANGASNQTVDAGLYELVSLGNRVFFDVNGDGVQDAGEPGIVGVPVQVVWLGEDGVVGGGDDQTFNTTTGANGAWNVGNLPPGSYRVTSGPAPSGFDTLTDSIDNAALSATNPVVVSTTSGVDRTDIDFGYRGSASLGDRVWLDADSDGVQDTNGLEPGIPGLPVTLVWFGQDGDESTTADNVTFTTTTGADGIYGFSNLPTGSFRVSVDPTAGGTSNLAPTYDLDGINPLTPGYVANSSVASIAAPGDAVTNVDFGYVGTASVGNRVWIDRDRDGVQDSVEQAISGAVIVLVSGGVDGIVGGANAADDITFTVTTTTDSADPSDLIDGIRNYIFAGLPVFGASDAYTATVQSVPAALASVVMTYNLNSGPIPLASQTTNPGPGTTVNLTVDATGTDQNRRDVDWGFGGTSGLSGTVYRDDNNNGTQELQFNEAGIAGVRIVLEGVDQFGQPVLDPGTGSPYETVTAADGTYSFVSLVPGTYTIREFQPTAYNDGIDTAGSLTGNTSVNDVISNIPLGVGDFGTAYNFGELGTFVSGTVFRDAARNGNLDPTDPGIAGIVIELYDPTGTTLLATAVTDQNGFYIFPNIPAGNYLIREIQPVGYANTPTGSFQLNDRPVTVPLAGLTNQNYGEVLGSLSGVVYLDRNNNGSRQTGEPGLSGVTVMLTGIDAAGATVNRTAITDSTGAYSFDNLLAGTYTITEFQPTLYTDGLDGQNNPGGIAGSLGGTIGNDVLSAVTLPAGGAGANYNFGEIPPTTPPNTSSLSGTVWLDLDKDGTIDPNETGIPGVVVTLNGPGGISLTTTTGSDGSYLFTNLQAGAYTVTETQPPEYGNTTPNVVTATILPTLIPVTGVDFGEAPGTISGTVYIDVDDSGTRDAGEPPIAGVVVTLTGTDVNGNPITRTTTTDGFGNYRFTDLPASDATGYTVTQTQPAAFVSGPDNAAGSLGGAANGPNQFDTIVVPPGGDGVSYNFGENNPSATGTTFISGTVWLDRNRDGVFAPTERGINNVIVDLLDATGNVIDSTLTGPDGSYTFLDVVPGTYSVRERELTDPALAPWGSSTPDAIPVFVPPSLVPVTGLNFGETPAAITGSTYIDDDNDGVRDPGEIGIGGVTLVLTGTDVNGNPVNLTTTTNPDGFYQFSDLPASNGTGYTVTQTQPFGYLDGLDGQNNGAGTAGSLGGTIGNDVLSNVVVPGGQIGNQYNFGELVPDLSITKDDGRIRYIPNTAITYTIVVRNDGLGDVVGATISDVFDTSMLLNVSWTVSGTANTSGFTDTTVTPATGDINDTVNIGAGETITYIVSATVSAAARGDLVNTATVTLPPNLTDPTPENNTATDTDQPPDRVTGNTLNRLSGRVYLDRNQNSRYEGTIDRPLGGITVTLRDSAGTPVATALTAADGTYQFANLPAGQYTITETQPTGFGSSQVPFNVRTVTMRRTSVITNQNFGDTLGNISGKVYRDNNLNGVFSTNSANPDRGIRGIQVSLTDGAGNPVTDAFGNPVGPVLTDRNGNYVFRDLLPGNYTVVETQPALPTSLTNGFYDGADNPGSLNPPTPPIWTPSATKNSLSLLLGINNTPTNQLSQNGRNYNFGELPPADPFGFVYVDRNNNGVRDPGERGIAGVEITISGIAFFGTPLARPLVGADIAPGGSLTVRTDANGFYQFLVMPPGRYVIRERQPAGFIDGRESSTDPNAPQPGIGNDVFFNLLLNPFAVRGAFNFGELLPGSTTISKRGVLGSSMM